MGRVRSADVFYRSLKNQFEAKIDGSIDDIVVLSDKNSLSPELVSVVRYFGGEIVEFSSMPSDELEALDPAIATRSEGVRSTSGGMRRGTIWLQLRDVANATTLVGDTDVVVRTRPDVVIRSQDYAIAATRTPFLGTGPFGFHADVWVQWASISNPFYIHDTAFAAFAGDLRRFVNAGKFSQLAQYYPAANLPIFFWISPFVQESAALTWWLTSRSGSAFQHEDLFNPEFRSVLSFYFAVLDSVFDLHGLPIEWNLQWNGERTVKRNWDRARTHRNLEYAVDREVAWRGAGLQRRRHPAVNAIDSSRTLTRLLETDGLYPDLRRGYQRS